MVVVVVAVAAVAVTLNQHCSLHLHFHSIVNVLDLRKMHTAQPLILLTYFGLKKCTASHYCPSITLSKCPIMKAIYYVFSFSNSVFVLTALSRWTWVSRYENVSILDFIGAKDDGGGGDSWSYKT